MVTLKLTTLLLCALAISLGTVSHAGRWQKYSAPSFEIDAASDAHKVKHSVPLLFVYRELNVSLFTFVTLLTPFESHFLLSTGVIAQLMQTNHLALPPPFFV